MPVAVIVTADSCGPCITFKSGPEYKKSEEVLKSLGFTVKKISVKAPSFAAFPPSNEYPPSFPQVVTQFPFIGFYTDQMWNTGNFAGGIHYPGGPGPNFAESVLRPFATKAKMDLLNPVAQRPLSNKQFPRYREYVRSSN